MGFKGFFDPFPHPEIPALPHKSQSHRKQNRQDRAASPPHRPQHTFCNNAGMECQQRSSVEIHPGDMVRIPEQMGLDPGIHKLAEVVGREDGRTGIPVFSGKHALLEAHGKNADVNAQLR